MTKLQMRCCGTLYATVNVTIGNCFFYFLAILSGFETIEIENKLVLKQQHLKFLVKISSF
jgi:hypothetical protein